MIYNLCYYMHDSTLVVTKNASNLLSHLNTLFQDNTLPDLGKKPLILYVLDEIHLTILILETLAIFLPTDTNCITDSL